MNTEIAKSLSLDATFNPYKSRMQISSKQIIHNLKILKPTAPFQGLILLQLPVVCRTMSTGYHTTALAAASASTSDIPCMSFPQSVLGRLSALSTLHSPEHFYQPIWDKYKIFFATVTSEQSTENTQYVCWTRAWVGGVSPLQTAEQNVPISFLR